MARRRRWTDEEDELLVAFANRGCEYVSRIIKSETGSSRTSRAVKSRANQIGVSLARYERCPECNRMVRKLHCSTLLCDLCHEKRLAEETRARYENMRRTYTRHELDAIYRYRKERDRLRKAIQREREMQRDLEEAKKIESEGT